MLIELSKECYVDHTHITDITTKETFEGFGKDNAQIITVSFLRGQRSVRIDFGFSTKEFREIKLNEIIKEIRLASKGK